MKLPQTCDCVVVGGGLTGLITFKNLLDEGKNAILIEKSGKLGGSSFEFDSETKKVNLRSYIWTTTELNNIFNYETANPAEVLTIGKKGLTPFMGFGDAKVQALDFYNAYTENPSFKAKSFKENYFDNIDTKKIFTHTEITKLMTSEEDGLVDEVQIQINGQKTLSAKEIYWTATAMDFDQVLPAGQYGKFRQKVKKTKSFDCMSVSYELSEDAKLEPGRYIFFQDDHTPWVGELFKNTKTVYWTAYIDQNQTADHDTVRKQLKALKKFLNKAFINTKKASENSENEELEALEQKKPEIFLKERLTIHKAALSQLNISEKDEMMKIMPNVKFLGSFKKFWPHPFESKVANLETPEETLDSKEDSLIEISL